MTRSATGVAAWATGICATLLAMSCEVDLSLGGPVDTDDGATASGGATASTTEQPVPCDLGAPCGSPCDPGPGPPPGNETAPTFCDSTGHCVEGPVDCFHECDEQPCGAPCSLCNPQDPGCLPSEVPRSCDEQRRCSDEAPNCSPNPQCGHRTCQPGEYCCNPSCGTCAPIGQGCSETPCGPPAPN